MFRSRRNLQIVSGVPEMDCVALLQPSNRKYLYQIVEVVALGSGVLLQQTPSTQAAQHILDVVSIHYYCGSW